MSIHEAAVRFVIALATSLTLAALGGCTTSPDDTGLDEQSPGIYVEPAWMAESRQREEKDNADLVACLAQAGWEAAATPDQSVRPVTEWMSRPGTTSTELARKTGRR